MAQSSIDPLHSAMLSMDLQAGVVSIYTRNDDLVTRAGALLQDGREARWTIVHAKVGFRPGVPEIHPAQPLYLPMSYVPCLDKW